MESWVSIILERRRNQAGGLNIQLYQLGEVSTSAKTIDMYAYVHPHIEDDLQKPQKRVPDGVRTPRVVDRIECRYFSMELGLNFHDLGDRLEGILRRLDLGIVGDATQAVQSL